MKEERDGGYQGQREAPIHVLVAVALRKLRTNHHSGFVVATLSPLIFI